MSKLSSAPHLVKNDEVNVRVEMIQSLIPIALEAVADLLSHELDELAGPRYARKASSVRRWGRQGGSVYLGGQRIPISVPRARDTAANRELSLTTYKALQSPKEVDDRLLLRVLKGLSCRGCPAGITKLVRRTCPRRSVFRPPAYPDSSSRRQHTSSGPSRRDHLKTWISLGSFSMESPSVKRRWSSLWE